MTIKGDVDVKVKKKEQERKEERKEEEEIRENLDIVTARGAVDVDVAAAAAVVAFAVIEISEDTITGTTLGMRDFGCRGWTQSEWLINNGHEKRNRGRKANCQCEGHWRGGSCILGDTSVHRVQQFTLSGLSDEGGSEETLFVCKLPPLTLCEG